MTDKCLLILNEALYGGCHQDANQLKAMITDIDAAFTRKFAETEKAINYWNIMMLTNEPFAAQIPLKDNRRFVVFAVSEEKIGDCEYFRDLHAAIANGEDREFLTYLLRYPLPANWRPSEHLPRTSATIDMALQDNQNAFGAWFFEKVKEKRWVVPQPSNNNNNYNYNYNNQKETAIILEASPNQVSNDTLWEAFEQESKANPALRKISSKTKLTQEFNKLFDRNGNLFQPRVKDNKHCRFASMNDIEEFLEKNLGTNYFAEQRLAASSRAAIATDQQQQQQPTNIHLDDHDYHEDDNGGDDDAQQVQL